MTIHDTGKKATKAKDSDISALHQKKQAATRKFKRFMRNRNPDCFVIGPYIGILLDNVSNEDEAAEAEEVGVLAMDKKGNYYGVFAVAE